MTFVDTSAIYALVNRNDPEHARAVDLLARLLDAGEPLLTHNYVVVETISLLQRRIGIDVALEAATKARQFETEWISEAVHEEARQRLERARRRQLSFVDCVSFVVMQRREIDTAFAFDPHFEAEGFRLCRLPE